MAQQTINIGASPNDGTGTPLRTAFQYTNSNFSELYTAVGPSGNNIVVPGSATITGDLTVDTNVLKVDSANNRVGIGTASPNNTLTVRGSQDAGIEVNSADSNASRIITAYDPANTRFYINSTSSGSGTVLPLDFLIGNSAQYRIAASGVFTWYDGAGGTRMTLNSTGLGVGLAPANDKLLVSQTIGLVTSTTADVNFRNIGNTTIQRIRYDDSTGTLTIGSALGTAYPVQIGGNTTSRAVTIDTSGTLTVGTYTASPYKITINGDGSIGQCTLAFRDSSNSNKEFRIEQGSSALKFIESGNSTPFTIKDSNVVVSEAALATTATKGFLYIPTCPGTPTGTPATFTGRSPIVVDSTNNKLYFYSGGAWVAAN